MRKLRLSYVPVFLFFINCCFAGNSSIANKKIQVLLDEFCINSTVPAAVLSINFSNNNISNFVSGTVKKEYQQILTLQRLPLIIYFK